MYFVTTFTKLEKHELWNWELGSFRTVGYFSSLEDARRIVTNNVGDLCETIYEYALIEGIEEGLYPELFHQELYRVKDINVEENGREVYNFNLTYEPIPIPEKFSYTSVVIG